MNLPQARQQIAADIAARIAQHQTAIANAAANGTFTQPNPPLNLLADGIRGSIIRWAEQFPWWIARMSSPSCRRFAPSRHLF
jgi:hypothetical protein